MVSLLPAALRTRTLTNRNGFVFAHTFSITGLLLSIPWQIRGRSCPPTIFVALTIIIFRNLRFALTFSLRTSRFGSVPCSFNKSNIYIAFRSANDVIDVVRFRWFFAPVRCRFRDTRAKCSIWSPDLVSSPYCRRFDSQRNRQTTQSAGYTCIVLLFIFKRRNESHLKRPLICRLVAHESRWRRRYSRRCRRAPAERFLSVLRWANDTTSETPNETTCKKQCV